MKLKRKELNIRHSIRFWRLASGLVTDADLGFVMDVQKKLMDAIASHSPTLKVANEGIAGEVTYVAVDGESARTGHPSQDATGVFEVAPVWANKSDVFFSFDADTSKLVDAELSKRVDVANELVKLARASFDLEVEEIAP